jgi:hypothetical protein
MIFFSYVSEFSEHTMGVIAKNMPENLWEMLKGKSLWGAYCFGTAVLTGFSTSQ